MSCRLENYCYNCPVATLGAVVLWARMNKREDIPRDVLDMAFAPTAREFRHDQFFCAPPCAGHPEDRVVFTSVALMYVYWDNTSIGLDDVANAGMRGSISERGNGQFECSVGLMSGKIAERVRESAGRLNEEDYWIVIGGIRKRIEHEITDRRARLEEADVVEADGVTFLEEG